MHAFLHCLRRAWLPALLGVLFNTATAAAPRNILFVLADDHRHDALSFMGHPYLV